jgi:hypothetical protein
MFAQANAGGPTPDTNLVNFGSTNVTWINPSFAAADAATGGFNDGINYDPFNSSNQGLTFDIEWYKRSYALNDLQYSDGTVIPWQTGGALPIGYDVINGFNADPPLTGHMGLATDMGQPDNNERYASYLRIPVNVTQTASGPLIFEALVDDGAAVYLDDEPWFRINCCNDAGGAVPDNLEPWYTTFAFNATATEDMLVQVPVPGLSRGQHLISVSLHSNAPTSSDQGFDFRVFTPGNYRPWGVNASGNWADSANWNIDVAGANEFAMFGRPVAGVNFTGSRTIFTDTAVTLDGIQFEGNASYNIAGTGAINLSGRSGADASLNVLNGRHQFQVQVNLNKNTDADIAAGASIDFNNEFGLNSNTLRKIGDGDLIIGNDESAGDGTIDVMAGVLGGGGTVAGNVLVNGGSIAPAGVVDPLASAAILTINGNATVNTGGINLKVYGKNNGDGISGGGSGTLSFAAGTNLNVTLAAGYTPSNGDSVQAFPGWSSISGSVTPPNGWAFDPSTGTLTFGTVVNVPCDLDADGDCDIADIDSLVNTPGVTPAQISQWLADAGDENGFSGPLLPGDANLDGSVNAQDLNQVGQNWLASGTAWSSGDFNGDDSTNAQDLNLVGQNWLSTVPSAAAAAAVPEPSSLGLLAIAALLGLMGGCRRK